MDTQFNSATRFASDAVKSAGIDPPNKASMIPPHLSSALLKAHTTLLECISTLLTIGVSICTALDAKGVIDRVVEASYNEILKRISGLLEQTTIAVFRLLESIQNMNPADPLYRTAVNSTKDQVKERMKLFQSTNIVKEAKQAMTSKPFKPSSWVSFYLDTTKLQEKLLKMTTE